MTRILTNIRGDTNNRQYRVALQGNAKIYEGTRGDNVLAFPHPSRTTPFSILLHFRWNGGGSQIVFSSVDSLDANLRGILIQTSGNRIDAYLGRNQVPSNRILARSGIITPNLYNTVILTYDGTGTGAGTKFYVNGRLDTTILENTLTELLTPTSNANLQVGYYLNSGSFRFLGNMRKVQMINLVPSDKQLRQAYNAGTFEGIIPDGDFRLDLDYNKTGTDPLTTRFGTPTHTVTAINTPAYTPYYV